MSFDPADVTPSADLGALTIDEIGLHLTAARRLITTELEALGDRWAAWRPAPGEWSANECVGHIIEADRRGFAGRIRRILAEDGVSEQGWDQIATASDRRDWERTVHDVMSEFTAGRDEGIALVRSLQPDDLERHAVHGTVGRVTISNLLHEWVFHDRNHIRQLLKNAQARAWPSMGNAQRFSHPDR